MIVAVLQARCSSSRLPGKVLAPLLGKPMLDRQLERIKRCSKISKIVVATSVDTSDNPVQELCVETGTACFRGSLDDVLDRFYNAAIAQDNVEHVVRLTGDCPLADPDIIDRVIALHLQAGYDYTTNTMPPTYPDGLDVEIMTLHALADAWQKANKKSDREHVTPYIRQNAALRHGNLKSDVDLSHLRWTVDESKDFELISAIYEQLYPAKPDFALSDILELLDRMPELAKCNSGLVRNEGYAKSLALD